MIFLRSTMLLTAAVLATVMAQPCAAATGAIADLENDRQVMAAALQSGGPSLSEAVEQVRRQYGGRIISAETRRRGNREVHHIKVLTPKNKVKTVKINGRRLT